MFLLCGYQQANAQNGGRPFSLGFYTPAGDSGNVHSSMRDFSTQTQFDLPATDSARFSGFKGWVYRKLLREDLVVIKDKDYSFNISFLPDWQAGHSSVNGGNWLNTRGVSLSGKVGNNLTFRSEFYENQGKFPQYTRDFAEATGVMPGGLGEVKPHELNHAYDFAYSTALINYKAGKYFDFQLGYDKNFIGDGYRSMLLSDNAFNYPFFKLKFTAGQVQYTAMWAQFIDMAYPMSSYDNGYRKKWGAFNYLDWNVTKKFSIGLFESVIWQDSDSTGKRGFDVSYLNPILFLRPVEFANGSPDNALIGFNLKYATGRKSALYGQLLLDEFKIKELKAGKGWWANKFGGQLGFRANDAFGIANLNVLTETNFARPFTFSERSTLNNYGHDNLPLAHPMGANFVEWVNIADYRIKRWFFRGEVMYAREGLDSAGYNFGHDIFKSYDTRAYEYGNYLLQGLGTNVVFVQGKAAFLLNPANNLRLELTVGRRSETNSQWKKQETFFSFGLRSSFRQLVHDF
ncbi:hypothetical protein [Deminuibacter soli]|uniref:hypothetical protein n=1 Tax=Deminuibacter soli TaxID=2291815 RepID=UPI0011C1476F|nr:hypothetical protein [Deminuibacter soli]